jgi:hypothetical protein
MKFRFVGLLAIAFVLAGCDRVGSEAWCAKQKEKPKSEWTMEETGEYTKYCMLGMDSEKWCEELEEKPKSDWSASEAGDYAKYCLTDRRE